MKTFKKIKDIEKQIKQLSSLIDAGEKKLESLDKVLFDQFIKTLKPKRFKNKTDSMVASLSRNYKGYVLKELLNMHSEFIADHREYNTLLNAVRTARATRYQLSKDYEIEVEIERAQNKKYVDTSNFIYEFKPVEGSSMPNLPWERIF
ncbi:TPA: hypothetical protein ACX6QN_001121 [Photobacterium damselae]|uniref:hypothetical protein n=1 Tax=Photobacterium damselae TaxID=38293 RepID=UPI0040694EFF